MNQYEAVCTKEIFWKGKTYIQGDSIKILEPDMHILFNAGVIGAMKKIVPNNGKEYAIREAPENAMQEHGRPRGRPARQL